MALSLSLSLLCIIFLKREDNKLYIQLSPGPGFGVVVTIDRGVSASILEKKQKSRGWQLE